MRQDKTVQYQPICDTYSAAPLYMRYVQCTDTDPCHMRHVYAGCMQNEQATHLVSSSSIHGSVLLRNTSQSSPGQLQIYLYHSRSASDKYRPVAARTFIA